MSTTVTRRVSATASGGKTSRVTEAPVWTLVTSRISFLLALEGDESGVLLLDGDVQNESNNVDTDALKLDGDVRAIGGTATKRVAEAVT